jgi:ketosteroid isomerase-like protein
MKKLFMVLPLAMILCFMVGCQDKEAMAELEEQDIEITKLEVEKVFEELHRATLDSDIETLERLYADEYILTTREGKTTTKAVRIAKLKSGELDYLESQRTDVEIRVLGDTAVVTGQTVGRAKRQGQEIDQPLRRFTCVFAKHRGKWQMLARHACEILQEQ